MTRSAPVTPLNAPSARPAVAALLAGLLMLVGCQQPGPAGDAAGERPPATDPPRTGSTDPLAPTADQPTDADQADEDRLTVDQWNRAWTELLARYVDRRTGGVDYQRLKEEQDQLDTLIAALAEPRDLGEGRQRLAFLLNAYNLLVIATVVQQPSLPATVRDIDGFFDGRRHRLLGRSYTLDELRDSVIRPLGEPRAHFAMANGAAGGPPLLPAAYSRRELERQLDYQRDRFLADPVLNTTLGPTLMLSPIFRWFSADFEAADDTLAGFLADHAPAESPIGRLLQRDDDPPVSFLQFNWALNHVPAPDLPIEDDMPPPEEEPR